MYWVRIVLVPSELSLIDDFIPSETLFLVRQDVVYLSRRRNETSVTRSRLAAGPLRSQIWCAIIATEEAHVVEEPLVNFFCISWVDNEASVQNSNGPMWPVSKSLSHHQAVLWGTISPPSNQKKLTIYFYKCLQNYDFNKTHIMKLIFIINILANWTLSNE